MQVFRSHTTVPESITSPTLRGLAEEWVRINESAEYHRQVQALQIAGCLTPGDVVDAIDAGTHEQQNQMLLRLMESDSYLATRIALQALLPRIVRDAQRRWRIIEGLAIDDHIQTLISEVWDRAANYPLHRTKHVAMELLRPFKRSAQDLFEESLPLLLSEDHEAKTPPEAATDPSTVLERVLEGGLEYGLVTTQDLELISAIYIKGHASSAVAAAQGLSYAAVRKRCQRIKERLALVPGAQQLVGDLA